jgi:hypothetical protein
MPVELQAAILQMKTETSMGKEQRNMRVTSKCIYFI